MNQLANGQLLVSALLRARSASESERRATTQLLIGAVLTRGAALGSKESRRRARLFGRLSVRSIHWCKRWNDTISLGFVHVLAHVFSQKAPVVAHVAGAFFFQAPQRRCKQVA